MLTALARFLFEHPSGEQLISERPRLSLLVIRNAVPPHVLARSRVVTPHLLLPEERPEAPDDEFVAAQAPSGLSPPRAAREAERLARLMDLLGRQLVCLALLDPSRSQPTNQLAGEKIELTGEGPDAPRLR